MMDIRLMEGIVTAVESIESRRSFVESAVRHWGHDPESVRFLRASANVLFVYTYRGNRYYLRINHANARPLRMLRAEMQALRWLGARGVRVAMPAASTAGEDVVSVDTQFGRLMCVVFCEAPGSHLKFDALCDEHFVTWGSELGRLHCQMQNMPDATALGRPSYVELLQTACEHIHPEETHLLRELEEVDTKLSALPKSRARFGLIHFDFELDNLLWDGWRVAVVDFDDCARLWYAADVIYALRDLFLGREFAASEPRFRLFLEGYRSHTQFDESDTALLPLFFRLHRLFAIGRLRNALPMAESPRMQWADALCSKLRGYVELYSEDIRKKTIRIR